MSSLSSMVRVCFFSFLPCFCLLASASHSEEAHIFHLSIFFCHIFYIFEVFLLHKLCISTTLCLCFSTTVSPFSIPFWAANHFVWHIRFEQLVQSAKILILLSTLGFCSQTVLLSLLACQLFIFYWDTAEYLFPPLLHKHTHSAHSYSIAILVPRTIIVFNVHTELFIPVVFSHRLFGLTLHRFIWVLVNHSLV